MSRLLYLSGPYGNHAILSYLREVEDEVIVWKDPIRELSDAPGIASGVDHVVSCNYKHLLPLRLLAHLPPVVNLHISYLPWNRGSQPNFWSWVQGTVKGVSIHQVTKKVDGGPIYAQAECNWLHPERETLASTHAYLHQQLVALFRETWPQIKRGELAPVPQEGVGSYHDRAAFSAVREQYLGELGWETPVLALREKVPA